MLVSDVIKWEVFTAVRGTTLSCVHFSFLKTQRMEEDSMSSPERKKQRQGDAPEEVAAEEERQPSLAAQYQNIMLAPLDRKNRRGRAKYIAALISGDLPDDMTMEAERCLLDQEADAPWLQHVEAAAPLPPPSAVAAPAQPLAAAAPAQTTVPALKRDKSK